MNINSLILRVDKLHIPCFFFVKDINHVFNITICMHTCKIHDICYHFARESGSIDQ